MMSACGIQTSCRSLISAAISPSPKLRCRRRGAITALHSGRSQIGDPCGAVCLLWPRRTKRKYRFDCCVVDWVLIRICRISIDHVKYISSTYAERLPGLYSALSRLFRHIVLLLLCHKILARFEMRLSVMEILTRGGELWVSNP